MPRLVLAVAILSAPVFPAATPGNVYLGDPAAGAAATIELMRLSGDGTRLDGQYAHVRSHRLDPDGRATAGIGGTSDFRYQPNSDPLQDCTWKIDDCAYFDAVNVYYHIDRFASEYWVDRLGVDVDFQARAVTHRSGDGAVANRSEWSIWFGLGATMMKNSALEDDIIYHEYTHLVTQSLGFTVDTTSSVQTHALNEGFAHYFAASYTDDPRIGEWVATCPSREHCTGPPDDTEIATLATDPEIWNWGEGHPARDLRYGVCTRFYALDGKCKINYHNFTETYTWGMIWGSALWDLRKALGAGVADRLVLHAVTQLGKNAQFDQALRALMEADLELYDGNHSAQIESIFSLRGIKTSMEVDVEESLPVPQFQFRVDGPNPFADRTRFHIDLQTAAHLEVAVYDVSGRRIRTLENRFMPAGPHAFVWEPQSLPAGRYFGVVRAGSIRKTVAVTFLP